MTAIQIATLATDLASIATNVAATTAQESSSLSLAPEWLLIGLGSILVLSAKAVLFLKATRALSTNANK